MAYDAFIKFDGIDGESLDAKHKNWVDVLSFSWGVSQPHAVSGQFTGHVVPEDFSLEVRPRPAGRPSTSASTRCCFGLAKRYSAIASASAAGSSGEGGCGRIARCSSIQRGRSAGSTS